MLRFKPSKLENKEIFSRLRQQVEVYRAELDAYCYEKCVVMYMLSTLGFGLFHLCLFFLTAVMRFRTDAFFALHRDRFSDLS